MSKKVILKYRIPKQLRELKFCKVRKGEKKPYQLDWPNKLLNVEEIEKHIGKEGKNYGVLCGHEGLSVIDADTPEIINVVEKNLPQTFTVRTGGGGSHYYFFCKDLKKKIVIQTKQKHYGEVQSYGSQVIGPGSTHPNGKKYEVIKDYEIAQISKENLILTLRPYMKELKDSEVKVIKERSAYEDTDINSISITQVMNLSGFKKASSGEYYGSNPWHGSDTKMNTWINPTKNVAHCFRCNEGISVAKAIALNKGIINNCDESISREDFFEVLKTAREDYGLKRPEEQFRELDGEKVIDILGKTIKKDEANKLITFLGQLTAFTEDAQLNISNNSPSSTGKSYIPTEISRLFPNHDVITVGYCSPTAFFHDVGTWDKEKKQYIVDLSRKILIFLDQPHNLLLQHLRPILSHDEKEITLKVTDKSQKHGLKTKNIVIRGFPVVIFCTAGLKIDEQEATRFILLSPETSQEKIRDGILEKIKKDSNKEDYLDELNKDPERKHLKKRITIIKYENVLDVMVNDELKNKFKQKFFSRVKIFKPRHQRDVGKIMSFVKAFALLNLWFRKREKGIIKANEKDIEEGFNLWDQISQSQELSLPPFIYNIYKEVILPTYKKKV